MAQFWRRAIGRPLYGGAGLHRGILSATLLFVAYVGAAVLTVYWGRNEGGGAVFWAANGVLTAALLCLPRRLSYPLVALCFPVNLALNISGELPLDRNLIYTSLNFFAAISTAVLTRRWCGAATDLSRIKRIQMFALAAGLSVGFEASLGSGIEIWLGATGGTRASAWSDFIVLAGRWFASDFLGFMLLGPASIMLLKGDRRPSQGDAGTTERIVLFAVLALTTSIGFAQTTAPVYVAVFPLVLLASFRLGRAWIYLAVYVVAVISTAFTVQGYGPFMLYDPPLPWNRNQVLQLFLFSIFLAAIPATSALAERMRTEARRLDFALRRLSERATPPLVEASEDSALQVEADGRTHSIRSGELVCIEAEENYCRLMLTTGRSILTRMTLASLEAALPPDVFVRTHRSHLINLARVASAERRGRGFMIVFGDGREAPIARNRVEGFTEAWARYSRRADMAEPDA